MAAFRPVPDRDAVRRERIRLFVIAASVSAFVAVPVGISVGMSWVDLPWSDPVESRAAPDWVPMPQVRATTIDGSVVKARVALDVEGSAARNAIQRRTQQVGLVLEVAVSSHTRDEIRSTRGIERLSVDMRDRLNAFLESEGPSVVRAVAIQDLIVNPQ
jgi:flagellar basal body-associated protein FliL